MIDNSNPDLSGQDEFLTVLAHELRNPLAPLRNGLQIIRLAKNDPAAVDQALNVMDRQLQQMVRLIDDLVDASRVNRGQIELSKETVDLTSIITDAIEASRGLTEQKGLHVKTQLPSGALFVEGDARRLKQVVANLLANASKYSGRNGVIEITAERKDSSVEVAVSDQGVGISEDMLPKIFDMFTKADRSLEKAQDGLGVGLTIARRIVELHGGEISAQSNGPGTGSRFTVTLPISTKEKKSAGPRVLIVDDNKDFAMSMAIMLKMMGSETEMAADGVEALRLATTFRPDVVFLDIGLPKLNGYDVCRVIREQAWGKDVMIVALTGWGQPEDKEKSLEAGFNKHLVKPVENAALERIIHEASHASAVAA